MNQNEKSPNPCAACLARLPERLVVMGLRGWIAGYETGDIACWEAVWNDYARELGPERAKPVVAELAAWVRTLCREGTRPVACYPRPCRVLCRDECMALGLVAGCQAKSWGTASEAAKALGGDEAARAVFKTGRNYATALAAAGQKLEPMSAATLAAFEGRQPASPLH